MKGGDVGVEFGFGCLFHWDIASQDPPSLAFKRGFLVDRCARSVNNDRQDPGSSGGYDINHGSQFQPSALT